MLEENELEATVSLSVKDQLARLVCGTVVGFLAGKLAETAFDKLVIERRRLKA